jgi:tRNA A37 threonylcarbamoyladenosine synthetase subunit TsaC/SUA5/YrdC
METLGEMIDGVIDAGSTQLGRESTVVEVIGDRIHIHREAAISSAALEQAIACR